MEGKRRAIVTLPGIPRDITTTIMDLCTPSIAPMVQHELEASSQMADLGETAGSSESCSCLHWVNYKVPCRHMFFRRNFEGKVMFSSGDVPQQWQLQHQVG